jgi:GAF domain/ANTAR domain
VNEAARRRFAALANMASLAGPAEDPGDVVVMLERACMTAVDLLGATGAGISLMADEGGHGFAAASDAFSRQLEELQFTLGEGPCIDAFTTGRPVLVPDLSDGHGRRWPMYVSAVRERGVRAIFAFPIQIGGSRLGVLDVFRDKPGSLTPEQLGQAVALTDVVLTMTLDGQRRAPAGALPQGFDEAPGFHIEIAQAQGMIMIQLGVNITEALVRLRAYAYAQGRPVSEVARDVVARRLRFDDVDS